MPAHSATWRGKAARRSEGVELTEKFELDATARGVYELDSLDLPAYTQLDLAWKNGEFTLVQPAGLPPSGASFYNLRNRYANGSGADAAAGDKPEDDFDIETE
jgi:hypothetical protein